jgi:hypothetical protein
MRRIEEPDMRTTLREFILRRIAEDERQVSLTAEMAWDHAGTMKTALGHRAALGTLMALVGDHEPGDDGCEECGQGWPCQTLRTIARTWREDDEFDEDWLGEG